MFSKLEKENRTMIHIGIKIGLKELFRHFNWIKIFRNVKFKIYFEITHFNILAEFPDFLKNRIIEHHEIPPNSDDTYIHN